MKPEITTPIGLRWARALPENEVSPPFTSVFVRAVLHKEFVRPKSDKLLAGDVAGDSYLKRDIRPASGYNSSLKPTLAEAQSRDIHQAADLCIESLT